PKIRVRGNGEDRHAGNARFHRFRGEQQSKPRYLHQDRPCFYSRQRQSLSVVRHDNVAPVISWIAGIVAVIVALTLPLGYFGVAYRSLATELAIEAKFRSGTITRFINDRPLAWTT